MTTAARPHVSPAGKCSSNAVVQGWPLCGQVCASLAGCSRNGRADGLARGVQMRRCPRAVWSGITPAPVGANRKELNDEPQPSD
jgi:hypothetical protein